MEQGEPDRRDADPHPLAHFIVRRRQDILALWETNARALPIARALERPVLMDHIPAVLDRIAYAAANAVEGDGRTLPNELAEAHAVARLNEGFDLSQVVLEFSILRDAITTLWEEESLATTVLNDLRILNHAIDRAVSASIKRYTEVRDRTTRALDRLAIVALESGNLDDLLRRLLAVMLESTPAVDTAAIFLRDGSALRLRATVGLEDDMARGFTLSVGEGIAGTIAKDARPLSLRDAAADPRLKSDVLRKRGVRALYGVPLTEGGQIIGVAKMGSLTAHEFSNQDIVLFSTMATRATAAIYHHLLREEAEQKERDFRDLADNISQLAWMANPDGARFWFNRRFTDYTGMDAEAAAEWGWRAAHHPDHVERVTGTYKQAMREGTPWEEQYPLRGKGGVYRWFLSRAVPIRDDGGRVARWFGTSTDVTEERFASEATKLLSSSLDLPRTLERLAQMAVPDLGDLCVIDLVDDGTASRVAVPPSAVAYDAAHVVKSGVSELHATSICVPLIARGKILGALSVASTSARQRYARRDVELLEEVGRRTGVAIDNARLYQQAQSAIRLREEVLAVVSHDLRNPLNSIHMTALSMLHAGPVSPELSKKNVDRIERSVTRMDNLIADLLDTSRVQTGHMKLDRRPHGVRELVSEVVELHAPLAQERGIAIIDACELPAGTRLVCDRDRVQQVLANVLGNALKFCGAGNRVTITGELDRGHAHFAVRDDGPGIAPEALPHIFEPYWSAVRHRRRGTGLGLYISKGIVEAHGGRIWAESEPGRGCTLHFTLPLAP